MGQLASPKEIQSFDNIDSRMTKTSRVPKDLNLS